MEDDPDNFVIYGNALPALEEEEASAKKMKPVPIEEQVATDEQGRRRYIFVILKLSNILRKLLSQKMFQVSWSFYWGFFSRIFQYCRIKRWLGSQTFQIF